MLPGVGSAHSGQTENRRKASWRETDLRRAIVAAKKAGLRFYSIEIAPDGTISIVVGGPSANGAKHRLRQRAGKAIKH